MGGDVGSEVGILGGLSTLAAMQGRTGEVEKLITQAKQRMDELGEWVWLFSYHRADTALWQDDPVAAELELRPALNPLKKLGDKSRLSPLAQLLARAVYLLGRYDEALQLTRECEEAARPNDVHDQIMWRSTRAKVLARRGELAAAERLGREAITIAEASDFLPAHAEALMDLAEVWQFADRREDAEASIEEAIRLFERKGNLVATDRARARLEELRV